MSDDRGSSETAPITERLSREPAGLSYDDVLLVPRRSGVGSRADIDISSTLVDGVDLEVPVLSAAMDSVTETKMALAVARAGGLGVLHRFLAPDEQTAMARAVAEADFAVGAAVGLGADERDRADALVAAGVDLLVLDVAHGHLDGAIETTRRITEAHPAVPLCAGNVATAAGVRDLAEAGADVVKVGIGPGSHCTTREVTGFGVPQFTAVDRCVTAAADTGVGVVADGGIRTAGDAVKALLAGADAVMVGGYLAGCDEAPGALRVEEGDLRQYSRGMATVAAAEARSDAVGEIRAEEGVEASVPHAGPVADRLDEFAAGIRSGFSYAGAEDLATARRRAEFMRISASSSARGGPHGVARER